MQLLELALDAADAKHRRERHDITNRTNTLGDIQETLTALQAAGLLLIPQTVRIAANPLALALRGEFEVGATAAADARNLGRKRLIAAGFREAAWPAYAHMEAWRHPSNWLLMITWLGRADVSTSPAEVAA